MGNEKSDLSDGLLRTAQLIIGALASGVFFFLIIVTLFLGARVQPFDVSAMISLVMAGFALASIPTRLLVPGLVVNTNCRKIAQGTWVSVQRQPNAPLPETDEGKLLQVYLSKTIIGAAILEGGAFANLVAFMLEGQIYSIVLAVLLLLGILAAFPTRTGLTEWVESHLRRVQEFRSTKRLP